MEKDCKRKVLKLVDKYDNVTDEWWSYVTESKRSMLGHRMRNTLEKQVMRTVPKAWPAKLKYKPEQIERKCGVQTLDP